MEILLRESGTHFPEIVVRKVVSGFNPSRKEATTEGLVGYYRDTKFTTGFKEVDFRVFDVKGPGRVFDLYCGD